MKFVNPRNAPEGSTGRVAYWDENRNAGLIGAIPPAKVVNDLQDEVIKVIEEAGLTPDESDPTQLWQALQALIAGIVSGGGPSIEVPPGIIAMHGSVTAPTGWLKCNGQAVSRATYADLFTAVGTAWGNGDGVTTFNVPDFRGEFARGFDDARGIDPGRAFASHQMDELKAHTHSYQQFETIANGERDNNAQAGLNLNAAVTGSTGGSETRPRNLAVLYIIKT